LFVVFYFLLLIHKIRNENMLDRDAFKRTLNNRGGTFFKFYKNGSLLRYGYKNKYFFESKVLKSESRNSKSVNGTLQKFIIVYIDAFEYVEGKIPFNATVQKIDGENDTYIIFILIHQLHTEKFDDLKIDNLKDKYLEQIIQHEMNHIRTNDLLNDFTDETKQFVSEVLSDALLNLKMQIMRNLSILKRLT